MGGSGYSFSRAACEHGNEYPETGPLLTFFYAKSLRRPSLDKTTFEGGGREEHHTAAHLYFGKLFTSGFFE